MSVIEVRGLRVELTNGNDVVDDVSFTVEAGEIVGLVGESGSGKTTVGTSLLGYVRGGARIVAGEVLIVAPTWSPRPARRWPGSEALMSPTSRRIRPRASTRPARSAASWPRWSRSISRR